MKYSRKGTPPTAFRDWLQGWPPDRQPTFGGDLQKPEKPIVHQGLLQEQGHVCAYCGRAILSSKPSHIEHFRPQATFRDLDLDWGNLFVSCGPGEERENEEEEADETNGSQKETANPKPKKLPDPLITCGAAKEDWFEIGLEAFIPSDPRSEQKFHYDTGGRILPRQSNDVLASKIIDRLNLNDRQFRGDRAKLLKGFDISFRLDQLELEDIRKEISAWRTPNRDGRLRSFGHVVALYLENEFGLLDESTPREASHDSGTDL
jgi:uncharacterized protein (TIGR02646 family)